MTELAQTLYLDISTVSRLIEKLEIKNFAIRDSSPGITRVYLTDMGNQMYDNVIIGIDRFRARFKSALGKKSSKELNRVLKTALKNLKEVPIEE